MLCVFDFLGLRFLTGKSKTLHKLSAPPQPRISRIRADFFESFANIRVIRGKVIILHDPIPSKPGEPIFFNVSRGDWIRLYIRKRRCSDPDLCCIIPNSHRR